MRRDSFQLGTVILALATLLGCATDPLELKSDAPAITTDVLPEARVGDFYLGNLSLAGGQEPYTWELVDAGPFRDWLNISPALLSGKPEFKTVAAPVTVRVTDVNGLTGLKELSLSVGPCSEGRDDLCSVSMEGQCLVGRKVCRSGEFGLCEDLTAAPSSDVACGASCRNCLETGGDRCQNDQCFCGSGGSTCTDGQTCCIALPTEPTSSGTRCTNTKTDPNACGGCTPCSVDYKHVDRTCSNGHCTYPCESGYKNCTGDPAVHHCETHVAEDPNNCGACSNVCGAFLPSQNANPSCVKGRCEPACIGSFRSCGRSYAAGCPVNIDTDVLNCGSCLNDCTGRPNVQAAACAEGKCQITACKPDFANCDGDVANGCETRLDQVGNCGACGNVCSGAPNVAAPACIGSQCKAQQCSTGFADCNGLFFDGCETPLNTQTNCGRCGNVCSGTNALGAPYLCNPSLGRCCIGGGPSGCR
jgi:hypothetical protein